jgi:hypothetical protein
MARKPAIYDGLSLMSCRVGVTQRVTERSFSVVSGRAEHKVISPQRSWRVRKVCTKTEAKAAHAPVLTVAKATHVSVLIELEWSRPWYGVAVSGSDLAAVSG